MRPVARLVAIASFSLFLVGGVTGQSPQPTERPQITAIEPKAAATTPGSKVKIYGTSFPADSVIYFGGLEVRELKYVGPSTLEVITPYLRPGEYQLQLRAGETVVESSVMFTAAPSAIDKQIDNATVLVGKGQAPDALGILELIAKTNPDHQVRAYAHYQAGQVYCAQGDWWRWGAESAGVFDPEAGRAVQTSWRYRLAYAMDTYFLPISTDPQAALHLADWTVQYDVTQNPEPRYFRALINARYGNLERAKADSDLILSQDPDNPVYKALGAYVALLVGDKTRLAALRGESITDPKALRVLGEAVYLNGDIPGAAERWGQAAKISPTTGDLACWAGKKHLAQGQRQVAQALLAECAASSPVHEHVTEANDLLVASQSAPPK